MKIIKTDLVVAAILIGVWVFYLNFEGATRFDISKTITLPLLLAADFTGLALLYVIGRYFFVKKKTSLFDEFLRKQDTDKQAQPEQSANNSENQSQDHKS